MTLIMPKGDGTLRAINSSIEVYYNNKDKDWLFNNQFKKLISVKMGFELSKDGEPLRNGPFLIKKSEIARYFGLIEYIFRKKGRLTNTGLRYYEAKDDIERIRIILKSLSKVSFNKGNSGVEKSDSHIEPPKLLLKAIHELKYISKQEFGLLLFRTVDEFKTFNEGIEEILSLRANKNQIPKLPKKLDKKYNDIKFVVFFENLKIIKKIDKDYYLSDYVISNYKNEIAKISIYNRSVTLNKKQISGDKVLYKNLVYPITEPLTLDQLDNRLPKRPEGKKTGRYKTDKRVTETVLANADYNCYFDSKHKTFIKKDGNIYMEGHHFIPMNAQDDFLPVNLDRQINIISLCPTCHKKMHKARKKDRYPLLKKVLDEKKESFENIGIKINLSDLYNNYYN